MVFERNESKVANLLATIDELVDHDKITVLVECIEEQEKALAKLRKQFEDHEVLSPKFRRKETEFQKMSLKERNECNDKGAAELREDLAGFSKDMKEQ